MENIDLIAQNNQEATPSTEINSTSIVTTTSENTINNQGLDINPLALVLFIIFLILVIALFFRPGRRT